MGINLCLRLYLANLRWNNSEEMRVDNSAELDVNDLALSE